MAKNKQEFKSLSAADMASKLSEMRAELSGSKFEHRVRGLQNPNELKVAKKNIARLLTEQRAKELSSATTEQIAKRSKIRLRRRLK